MDLRRMLREFNHGRSLSAEEVAPLDDREDGLELAKSAREFSEVTRNVLDEKLTFSAALLRAGEVQEANRILEEVEHDVRNEEAALLERMNEVSAKRAVTRSHMTRLRLVRMLATAMVGASLLGVSAMGMAVAGMFDEREKARAHKARLGEGRLADAGDQRRVKKVVIGGVAMKLTKNDLETYRRLISGTVDPKSLEAFLTADLDLPPGVVDQTIASVLSLSDPVDSEINKVVSATSSATEEAVQIVDQIKKKGDEGATPSKVDDTEPTEETQPGETETTPTPEETPKPEAEETDGNGEGSGSDGDGQRTGLPGADSL